MAAWKRAFSRDTCHDIMGENKSQRPNLNTDNYPSTEIELVGLFWVFKLQFRKSSYRFYQFIGHQQTNTTLFLLEQSFPIFMIIDVTAPYSHRLVSLSHSLFCEITCKGEESSKS